MGTKIRTKAIKPKKSSTATLQGWANGGLFGLSSKLFRSRPDLLREAGNTLG
jgi:hypothetical protein